MEPGQGVAFGTLVRRARIAAGLTQEELAERAGISRRSLSDMERGGAHTPRKETVALLAQALGLCEQDRAAITEAARRPGSAAQTVPMAAGALVPPFVGRTRELALLEQHLRGDGPPLLLLAGEPGIGKTRLLRAALPRAMAQGLCVLEGGCQQRGGQEPYAPFLAAFQRHLQSQRPGQQREELRGCAWLVRLLPEMAGGPIEPLPAWTVPPEHERRLMFAAVTRFLTNVAGPGGTLLVLDDLQWAGADALDLLATLVRAAAEVPLRIIGAYRDIEAPPEAPLSAMLADMTHARLVTRRLLNPLSPQEAAQLLDELLAGDTAGAALRAQVLQRTGGVPFFLVSCAQAFPRDGGTGDEEDGVPWNVAQGLRQRVASLPAPAREVLGVAAVLGREVHPAMIMAVVEEGEQQVLGALDAASQARLLVEQGEIYQFAHDVIREVVEADLGLARRMMLHRRIAQMLEQQREPPVEALAYHYVRAREHAAAAHWLTRAGDRAAAGYANATALEHYAAARDHLLALHTETAGISRLDEKLGDVRFLVGDYAQAGEDFARARGAETQSARRAELWHKEGLTYRWRGEFPRALAAFDAAEAAAAEGTVGGPSGLLRATLELSRGDVYIWGQGEWGAGVAAVGRAIALLSQESGGASIERDLAQAYALQGRIAAHAGDHQRAEASYRAALGLLERLGDHAGMAPRWNTLGQVFTDQGKLAQAEECFRRALAIAEPIGYQLPMGVAWHNLSRVAQWRGDLHQAEDYAHNGRAIAEQIGHRAGVSWAWGNLGWVALLRGDLEQAEADFQYAVDLVLGVPTERFAAEGLRLVARERGDLSVAMGRFRAARRRGLQSGDTQLEACGLVGQGGVHLRAGRLRAAALLLGRGHALANTYGWAQPRMQAALLQVELLLCQHNLDAAQSAAAEALRLAIGEGRRYDESVARRLLGQCALAQGEHVVAESHLRTALAVQTEMGAALEAARTRLLFAMTVMCGAERETGEEETRTLLDMARSQFAASGALLDLAQAEQRAAAWAIG